MCPWRFPFIQSFIRIYQRVNRSRKFDGHIQSRSWTQDKALTNRIKDNWPFFGLTTKTFSLASVHCTKTRLNTGGSLWFWSGWSVWNGGKSGAQAIKIFYCLSGSKETFLGHKHGCEWTAHHHQAKKSSMSWSVSSCRLWEMNCPWVQPLCPPTATPSLLHLPASRFKLPLAFCSCSFICSTMDSKACRGCVWGGPYFYPTDGRIIAAHGTMWHHPSSYMYRNSFF